MRALLPIATALLAAGCSPPIALSGSAVATETAGRIAGPAQGCISSSPQEGLRVLDAATLAYGHGRAIYVNSLGARCPGLEPTGTLIVEPSLGGQYCRGDHVRGREMGAIISGPTCILGDWVPYRKP
jgi:hypothetical protein